MCEHKRLIYIGQKGITRVYCADCCKELPADFGTNKPTPKATEAAETPVKAQKTTSRKKVK